VVEWSVWARIRQRLGDSGRAFSTSTRNRNLRRVQLSFLAAWTAEWALTVAIGVVAFRDGGAEAVGIVAFVRMAPSVLLAPIGTTLGDRLPREHVLLVSSLIRAGALGAATVILAAGASTLAVYALAIVATAAFTVFRPVHTALLPELSMTPVELTSANVARGLLDSVSLLVGPALAAVLLGVGSPAAVFGLTAGLSLWAGVLMVGLSYERSPRHEPRPVRFMVNETIEGFRAITRAGDPRVLVGVGLAQALTRGFLNVFLVVIAIELLHAGASGVGLFTAAVGAGAVAGSLGASMFAQGRRLATLEGIGVVLWALPLTLSGVIAVEPVVIGLMCVVGVANAIVDIGFFTSLPRLTPDSMLARVMGAFEALVALTVAIGSLVTPLVIGLIGTRGALVVLGLVAPLVVALAWRRLRAIDSSIAHRDDEIEVLKRVRMLRPLPLPAIDSLAQHVGHADFAAGQEVFRQGEEGDRFYLIERGEAEVLGDGSLIRTLGAGDGFGEIALLRPTPRTTTVRARTPLSLYTLDRQRFVAAVSGYRSSAREAETLVHDRLGSFDPSAPVPQVRQEPGGVGNV
jgi:MFS family permease